MGGGDLDKEFVRDDEARHFPSIIKLNVGGAKYETTCQTLSKQDSKISAILQKTSQDESGYFFLDRDGPTFRHLLNYIRYETVPSSSTSIIEREMIRREADYFGIRGLSSWAEHEGNDERCSQNNSMLEKFLSNLLGILGTFVQISAQKILILLVTSLVTSLGALLRRLLFEEFEGPSSFVEWIWKQNKEEGSRKDSQGKAFTENMLQGKQKIF
eukprot:CAMPEP_0117754998 /NCGR_PEP_ID=MMETSP0947-20121206/13183_1 /TAXON_ID=44440 /ORGANISM="Chattonella subsalsa, Strain CCMP2191" /LENGTH=213 /DNA_ID=CAMNT_0005574235 /DNA_START=104 /DNA_END=745 /DNA_ORIENTATION=+